MAKKSKNYITFSKPGPWEAPKLERITREQMLMEIAQVVARRGTCSRLQVGAIVHQNGRVMLEGYNGSAAGQPHCVHDTGEPTDKGCTTAIHAEANIVAWAARLGVALAGNHLVVTHSPCMKCAELIVNAGIASVTYAHDYRDQSPIRLLQSSGVAILRYFG